LAESIIADEMPAVAAWAIAGAASLAARRGYTIPASSEAIRNEWRIASNPVEQFVNDRCERGGREYAKHVYEVYREWCVKNGYSPLNVMNFGIRLRELGIVKQHTKHGTEYNIDVKPEQGGHSPI
jgi:phage/plasmid-associated DNA primase